MGYGLFLFTGIFLAGKYSIYFLLGGILFPILLYNTLKNFSNIVLFYIVFLPFIQHFNFYALKAGDFYVTPHMFIQFIILLMVFSNFIINHNFNQKKLNFLDKLIVFLVVATIFSLIYANSLPVNHTKRWLLFYTGIFENVSFYFVILYLLKTQEEFTKKIIISIVISSLSSLLIAYLELGNLGFNLIKVYMSRMVIGFGFRNTNLFGMYSAIIFPLYFYVLANKKFSNIKIILWASFIVISLLSVITFNRGTFLIIAIELFFLFFIKQNRKIIYLFITGVILGSIYFNELILLYIQRFLGGIQETNIDLSSLYRIEAWKLGVSLLFLFPFGLGAGGFQFAWERFGPYPQIYLGTPHQLFLSIGVDYGTLSMIVFILILIVSYYYSNFLSKNTSESNNLFRYLKISLIGFVCYGITTGGELSHLSGFTAPNNGYSLLLFTLLAIISFHSNYKKL
ncbi:MAG: hypothetical protein EHM47_02045 [Ignavibacteriales bacterium]|nr:MAG: hypothetical protein EHM47_02045 [Ignavibacteriales bacterium]